MKTEPDDDELMRQIDRYKRREECAALVNERDKLRADRDALRAMLKRVCERWTFTDGQQPTHTWHDWADVVPKINALLARTEGR